MRKIAKSASIMAIAIVVGGLLLMRVFAGSGYAPVQPIQFDHWQHVTKGAVAKEGEESGPQLECAFCHEHADKSSHATIPNVSTCMACHQTEKTDSPEIQKLTDIFEHEKQPAWKRVYWMEKEANVFFTHKPHIAAGVDCVACHGEVGQMHRVRRETDQTMGWCIDCHRKKGASVDCYICHR